MTLRCASVLVSLLFVVGIPSRTHAQEVQVPLDADSTLYAVDAELEDRLNLFPNVRGFQKAVVYRQSEDTYELVVQYRKENQTVRDRRTLTASEVEDLRRRVTRRLQATGTKVDVNQEGRADLLTTTTLLGIAEGGLLAGAIAEQAPRSINEGTSSWTNQLRPGITIQASF